MKFLYGMFKQRKPTAAVTAENEQPDALPPAVVARLELEREEAQLEAERREASHEEFLRQVMRGEGPGWPSGAAPNRLAGEERAGYWRRFRG